MLQALNDLVDVMLRLSVAAAGVLAAFLIAEPFVPPELPQIKARSRTMMLFDGVPDNKALEPWAR